MKQNFLRLLFLAILSIGCKNKSNRFNTYGFLKNVSAEVNKNCPVVIDSALRLENTLALPPATFVYNYTLRYDTVKYDIRAFETTLKNTTLNSVKTSPDAKMFRNLFATLEYHYSDTRGNYLFQIIIKPQDYK